MQGNLLKARGQLLCTVHFPFLSLCLSLCLYLSVVLCVFLSSSSSGGGGGSGSKGCAVYILAPGGSIHSIDICF